jgi:hypothetical protein
MSTPKASSNSLYLTTLAHTTAPKAELDVTLPHHHLTNSLGHSTSPKAELDLKSTTREERQQKKIENLFSEMEPDAVAPMLSSPLKPPQGARGGSRSKRSSSKPLKATRQAVSPKSKSSFEINNACVVLFVVCSFRGCVLMPWILFSFFSSSLVWVGLGVGVGGGVGVQRSADVQSILLPQPSPGHAHANAHRYVGGELDAMDSEEDDAWGEDDVDLSELDSVVKNAEKEAKKKAREERRRLAEMKAKGTGS